MNILIFNWRDPKHPWAGGAEVFLHEVARRWVRQGHRVTWFCGRHNSQSKSDRLDGIEIIRRGGIYTVYFQAALSYRRQLNGRFDVILDSANGIPFFTPLFSGLPKVALVHHVHNDVFFRELPWHMAFFANALERFFMPLLYRGTRFITVSESSRKSLRGLGISPENIEVVYNGVDRDRYRPGQKSESPLMVFVGRLRPYKSVDVAIEQCLGY